MEPASASATFNAPVAKVWQALTDSALVKQWMFGTTVASDWQKGSTITYSGEWEGKPYQDKGTIVDIAENEYIKMNYWSVAFGEDIPENYIDVNYLLESSGDQTILTITQQVRDEATREHSQKNWEMVLGELKKVVEPQV